MLLLPPFLLRVHSDHTSPFGNAPHCPPHHTHTHSQLKLVLQPQLSFFPQRRTVFECLHCGSADQRQVQLHRDIFRSSRGKKKKKDKMRQQLPCDGHLLLSPAACQVWHRAARTQFPMRTEHNTAFVPHTDGSLRS